MRVGDVDDAPWEKDAVETSKEGEAKDLADRWRELPEAPRSRRDASLPEVKGFECSGGVTNGDVKEYLRDEAYDDHGLGIRSVTYVDKFVSDGREKDLGYYSQDLHTMVILRHNPPGTGDGISDPESFFSETLEHEIGHHVYSLHIPKGLRDEWDEISRSSKSYVTDYAAKDQYEDFAETYKVYRQDPGEVHEKTPSKYEFMKKYVFCT